MGTEFSFIYSEPQMWNMKSYLLLRDNQESGPYTLDEIRRKNLQPFDLVWVEGESKAWCYPTELHELTVTTVSKGGRRQPSRKGIKNSLSPGKSAAQNFKHEMESSPVNTTRRTSPFLYDDVAKELFTEGKPEQRTIRRAFAINRNVTGLMLIFIGVVMGSFVVKNIVESFGSEAAPAEQARVIQSMSYQSDNAAYAPKQTSEKQILISNTMPSKVDSIKKAKIHPVAVTVTQTTQANTTPLDNSTAITSSQTDASVVQTTDQAKNGDPNIAAPKTSADADKKTGDAEKKDDSKDKEVKKIKDIKSMVHLSSNNYKVGFLGGVSDLEVQVSNDSPVAVDKATVQVNFLKPNGAVVKSETIEVNNIAPGKSKKIQVPSSGRGTKVQLRINSVSSRDGDAS